MRGWEQDLNRNSRETRYKLRSRRRLAGYTLAATLLSVSATHAHGMDLKVPGLADLSLNGYYKNFFLALESSDVIASGREDLNRARLMLHGRVDPRFDFAVHYEHQAAIDPISGSRLFLGSSPQGEFWDLSWSILAHCNVRWRHEIDRLYVHSRQDWGDVTVGRQAIGWGVGVIWAPLDLFGTFSPVEIDREFRPGVNAGRVLVALGPFTEAEAVYVAYGGDLDDQSAAVRWRTTLTDFNLDVGLVAGKFFDDVVGGTMVASQIWGAGVHGALNVTHNYGGGATRVGRQDFVRAVVGTDYRFTGDIVLLGEYHFNGFGASDPTGYAGLLSSPRLQRGEIFNVGRHYLGLVADWEVHPLVHLLAQGQWNLLDPSALAGPAFTISLADEAQLDAGAYFALGAGRSGFELGSEFGSAPDAYYVTAKIYF